MTNFDFLQSDPQFGTFSDVAVFTPPVTALPCHPPQGGGQIRLPLRGSWLRSRLRESKRKMRNDYVVKIQWEFDSESKGIA